MVVGKEEPLSKIGPFYAPLLWRIRSDTKPQRVGNSRGYDVIVGLKRVSTHFFVSCNCESRVAKNVT